MIVPSALTPTALRGWVWSALSGRGKIETAPSRTTHSRPLIACLTTSQPAVMLVWSVIGWPATSAPSTGAAVEVELADRTSVPAPIAVLPRFRRTAATVAVQAPEAVSWNWAPDRTTSVPAASVPVDDPKRGE